MATKDPEIKIKGQRPAAAMEFIKCPRSVISNKDPVQIPTSYQTKFWSGPNIFGPEKKYRTYLVLELFTYHAKFWSAAAVIIQDPYQFHSRYKYRMSQQCLHTVCLWGCHMRTTKYVVKTWPFYSVSFCFPFLLDNWTATTGKSQIQITPGRKAPCSEILCQEVSGFRQKTTL